MILRNTSIAAGLLSVIALAPAGAFAQPADDGKSALRFELDLDTQGGSFSDWVMNDIEAYGGLSASASIPRLGESPKWLPTFKIQFMAVSGESTEFWRLKWSPDAAGAPLNLVATYTVGKKDMSVVKFGRMFKAGDAFPVEISWSAGKMTVKVADETQELPLPNRPASIQVTSSTAEFKLAPLTLLKREQ